MDFRGKRLHVIAVRVRSGRTKTERRPLRRRAAPICGTRRPSSEPDSRHSRHFAKVPISATPLSFSSARMPVRFPRTMDDVNDAEEAELRRLEDGAPGGIAPSPSPPTHAAFALFAPRLDTPSPLPMATIDLTSELRPPQAPCRRWPVSPQAIFNSPWCRHHLNCQISTPAASRIHAVVRAGGVAWVVDEILVAGLGAR